MDRFRSFIKGAFSYPRQLLATHPVTAVSIIATSLLFAIYTYIEVSLGYEKRKNFENGLDHMCHIALAILFFAVFALCIESIRQKRRSIASIVAFCACGILSFFMSYITSDFPDRSRSSFWGWLDRVRDSLGSVTVALYIGALLVIALLLAVWFSYNHNIRQKFNDHVMNANSNIFFTSIIYGVIQLGVLFLVIIIQLLLFDDAFEFLSPIIILINGLFFAPAVICALIRENEKANMFMQVLVRYVMLTIALLAYAIIYIYILKLVITLSVPSNSVYAILTALFVISMFIAYMSTTFEEHGFLQKFAYNAPLVFAPFILMQCYTIIVRIGQYGLTPMRYFGVTFIIFEIVYIVYYTISYKRDKEIVGQNLLLIVCAIVIITIFIPGINARSLSTSLARRSLASYTESLANNTQLTGKQIVRANAAAGFLLENDFGAERLAKYFPAFDDDQRDELRKLATESSKTMADSEQSDDYLYPQSGWFSADLQELMTDGSLDVSGYASMKYVLISDGHDSADGIVSDTANLAVYNTAQGHDYDPIMNVDLSDYCKEAIRLATDQADDTIDYDSYRAKMQRASVIDINENARLYITEADIARNSKSEPVYVQIHGYLFEK